MTIQITVIDKWPQASSFLLFLKKRQRRKQVKVVSVVYFTYNNLKLKISNVSICYDAQYKEVT